MAGFEKRSKRYPTDLTDEEWLFIQSFLPPVAGRGRKPATDLRDVLDALRYLARTGGGWRMLPNDFPPWQTVYWWFRRFVRRLLFRTIHDVTLMLDREREGREQSPTAAVVDSLWRGDLDEKFPSIRMRTDRCGIHVVPALIDAGKRYSQV